MSASYGRLSELGLSGSRRSVQFPPKKTSLLRSGSSLRNADEFDKAATLVCDALEGSIHKQPLDTAIATFAYHVHLRFVLVIKDLLVPALLMMTFFERPFWCRGAECECEWSPQDIYACPYPTFDVWYLSDRARLVFETSVLFAALMHQLTLRIALGHRGYWLEDGHVFVAVVGAILANVLYSTNWFRDLLGGAVVLPYFRLMIFVSYSNDVQDQLRMVARIVPHYLRVGSLIILLMVCFAWAGVVLFPNTKEGNSPFSEGDTYFSNFREAMWNMFILVTTSNNPDVMAPAYAKNRWSCALFIIYLLVGFFFLTNLLLATVYNVYTEEKTKRDEVATANKMKNLQEAFDVLARDDEGIDDDDGDEPFIDTHSIRGLFAELNHHREVMYINDDRTDMLLEALNRNYESKIDFDAFVKLTDLLQFKMKRSATIRGYRGRLKSFVTSYACEYAVDALLVLNAIVIAYQTRDELYGRPPSESSNALGWELIETCFALLYVIEMLAKLYALGPNEYFRLKSNIFDFVATCLSVVTVAVVYYPNSYDNTVLIRCVLMIRLVRLLRLLVHVPEFQVIGESFFRMWSAAVKLVKLLFCVCYVFALVGMALYGGKINTDPNKPDFAKLKESDYYDSMYSTLNFNDMWSSFVLLFGVLVVNNWWVLADGFIAVSGPSARIYFIAFYLIGNLICVNICTAFILDAFISQYEKTRQKRKELYIRATTAPLEKVEEKDDAIVIDDDDAV